MEKQAIMKVEHILKSFGIVKAVNDVSLEVYPGEVRGLIGENGSGKSTLTSIIAGNQRADSGTMYFKGAEYKPNNSFVASEQGVSMIVQEQGTIDTITAAANIFAGREAMFTKHGYLNSKKLNEEARRLLDKVQATHIEPTDILAAMSFEDRKLVEIARAMYKTPELFIVDETTTALSHVGRNVLYELIKELKEKGKAILFISHDMDEVMQLCDSVTILRDGIFVDTLTKDQMRTEKLKELMVGREVMENYYRTDWDGTSRYEEIAMKVEGISFGSVLHNISFTLKKGEILGIGGLTESGMHELGKILFGLIKPDEGIVTTVDNVEINTPTKAIENRIGYVSKNRDMESLLNTSSIRDNIVLPSLDYLKKAGFFITKESEKALSGKWSKNLAIKMRSDLQVCSELSGGNKQKVVLAKWLGNESEIFILDCPTRGIDVGVKEAIYSIMVDLKGRGKSIIMISEELTEVIGMSDRIMIMKNGEITRWINRSKDVTEHEIIQYMI